MPTNSRGQVQFRLASANPCSSLSAWNMIGGVRTVDRGKQPNGETVESRDMNRTMTRCLSAATGEIGCNKEEEKATKRITQFTLTYP